jgi:hypothetical protein
MARTTGAKGTSGYKSGSGGVILDKKGKRAYGPEEATLEATDRLDRNRPVGSVDHSDADVASDRLARIGAKKISKRNPIKVYRNGDVLGSIPNN